MTTTLEQIKERLEKMKKKSSCGCPPFESLHEGPCWTEEFGGESKAYNRALKDVQSLLPQIITGVIEEIEKIVCERKCPFKDCKVCRDANIEIDEILKALKEVVKE